MISRRYIAEWKANTLWPNDAQVEQDLVIERALVELFSDDLIRKSLAFRGGTALHKIFMKPQVRYSEDIDLVQITAEPINPVLKLIRKKLKFLGTKRSVKQNENNNTIAYRFESEIPFAVENSWLSGSCNIISYELEELPGTKLRALYQRRKGRDLFDLYWAITNHNLDSEKIIHCYKEYMNFVVKQSPTSKMFY